MAADWTPREFAVVRRGYAPQQVDDTFSDLVRDLTALRAERDGLRNVCARLEAQVEQLASDVPTYRGLGNRIEQILVLAEEEATELRGTMAGEAQTVREEAQREADAVRQDIEQFAANRRGEADNLLRHTHAEAARAAEDFDVTLSKRREDAQRDFATRMATAEAMQLDAERRASSLREDCEAMLADAEQRGEQIIAAARAKAAEIDRDSSVRAERSRAESERELAALVARRDTINKQLTNVRETLANLTGSVVADPPTDPPTGGTAIEPAGAKPVTADETQPTKPATADETQVLPKASPSGSSRR